MKEFTEISSRYWLNWAGKPAERFAFDLQRFDSAEKTEEPTQRKKEESRKKGQVAKSAELSSVFVILTAFVALKAAGSYMYGKIAGYMRYIFSELNVQGDFTIASVHLLILNAGFVFMEIVLPILLAVLVVSVTVSLLFSGFTLAGSAVYL